MPESHPGLLAPFTPPSQQRTPLPQHLRQALGLLADHADGMRPDPSAWSAIAAAAALVHAAFTEAAVDTER